MALKPTVPHVGPWPTSAINDFSGGTAPYKLQVGSASVSPILDGVTPDSGGRIQPVLWQPVRAAYLPSRLATADHRGASRGDRVFVLDRGAFAVFDGEYWQNERPGFGYRYELQEMFEQKPGLPADLAPTVTDPGDSPASQDALRDDLVTNALAQIRAGLATAANTNKNFMVAGTNMTSALCTLSGNGGIILTTAGASADQAIILPHSDTTQTMWNRSGIWNVTKAPRFETLISTDTDIDNLIIQAGFKLTAPAAWSASESTDANAAFFRIVRTTTATTWTFVFSDANVDTITTISDAISPALAASTLYHIVVDVDASKVVRGYINGVLVIKTAALSSTTAIFKPIIGVQSSESAAKAIVVKGVRCSAAMAA